MKKIREILIKEANLNYKEFSEKIMPGADKMLGVKIPTLRKIAKNIYKNEDWKSFLKQQPEFWEELMLQAFVISDIKGEPETIINYVRDFVPKLNGWGVCDSFCSSLKFVKQNKKIVWEFIQQYFNSTKEYEIRFAFVMLLNYFIDEEYIDRCFECFENFKDDRYYSKMAAAWALSICYIKFPQKTTDYLKISKLNKWTYNKGIQKICESLRIPKETKQLIKTFKK